MSAQRCRREQGAGREGTHSWWSIKCLLELFHALFGSSLAKDALDLGGCERDECAAARRDGGWRLTILLEVEAHLGDNDRYISPHVLVSVVAGHADGDACILEGLTKGDAKDAVFVEFALPAGEACLCECRPPGSETGLGGGLFI